MKRKYQLLMFSMIVLIVSMILVPNILEKNKAATETEWTAINQDANKGDQKSGMITDTSKDMTKDTTLGTTPATTPDTALDTTSDVTLKTTSNAIANPTISPSEATQVSILVEKSKHMLILYNAGIQIASYKVGLSKNPIGKKTQVNDNKVPEGTYYVCTRNDKSKFYLSLGLSYPNESDANDGLRANLITKQQYDDIIAANEAKTRPDWYTNLGGEIMIHGGDKGSSKDWTTGCVAVDNAVMDILWKYVKLQTPVTIRP